MGLRAITVRGPFHGPSGHDHHVREFVRELHRQGVAVQLVDLPEWHPGKVPEHLRETWFDSLGEGCGARVALHFCMPHQVIRLTGKLNVNYTMFEADRVPSAWVRENRGHDLVIVPAESSRSAWIASGMPAEKVAICPLGIDPERFGGKGEPMELCLESGAAVSSFRTRFLNVCEMGPRKNVAGLLRAWIKATNASDDAVLILKLARFGAAGSLFPFIVKALERDLGKTLQEAAPVHVLEKFFADSEMPRLYAAATHYISMSLGEGWDQPMFEAAASGLRLIAPGHSAYGAYLDSTVAELLPYRAAPAKYWGDPATAVFFAGAQWWEPDEDAAAARIRAEIDGRGEGKASARERILAEFTWAKATQRLIEILSELEATKSKRWFFAKPR